MAQQRSREDYKVAWICPLEVEQIAAMEMLDEEHPALPKSPADHNVYSLGSINGHNVVIAGLHQPGNCPAATVVAQMRMTFPNLRFGLLVGIGGGVPVKTDNGIIRLGHVVVSKPTGGHSGALQYDHGKAKDGHFERTGALAPPPAVLLNAAQALAVQRARLDNDPVQHDVRRIDTARRRLRQFQYPGEQNDHLFPSNYVHQRQGASCATDCDPSKRIPRTSDDNHTFVTVHRGNIASGELVVKNASLRDTLAQEHGLLCFEMEAAGAIADFPCLVVRGISDYCDSHKNDTWHGYAAAVAAAYARQLFFHLPVDEVQRCSGFETQAGSDLYALPFKLSGVNSVNHFVARQEELGRLHKALKWTGERRTVVFHGLGGMAQRIVSEGTPTAYVQNAITNGDLDEVVGSIKRWLNEPKNNHWLVIYDNYDDFTLRKSRSAIEEVVSDTGNENDTSETGSKAYDIRPFLPDTEHGAVLITTRSSSVKLGQRIQLGKLADVKDSLAILASTSGRSDLSEDPDATTLIKKLDGLPLALATAGAYLDQVATSCKEYLAMYEKAWLRLQKESPELMEYDRALYTTWDISLRHIKRQNQYASKLLQLWAYFDNHDIWYELLRAANSEKILWLEKLTEDKLSFEAVMRVLCEYGLAEPNAHSQEVGLESTGYSMHGCVHAWTIHVLNTEINQELGWIAMQSVASHVPSRKQSKYWVVQRRLLQHADRCVEIFKNSADEEDGPWVFHAFGLLYADQGQLKDAEAMYQRALQGKEKALGPDHTSTLDTVNNLGILYRNQGRLKEAEAMYERALQGYEKALGPHHTSTLDTVNNLGLLYSDQGRLKEAEDMYERALQGKEKALGPYHTSTLNTINNLGILYRNQGRLKEAEAMYERALQGKEKALGPHHTSTLDTVNNLGLLYSRARMLLVGLLMGPALQTGPRTQTGAIQVGRDTAAAVCLEQGHPSGTILRLARNLGVPEDVASRLQGILHDLNAVALREKRPQDVENEILLKIATLTQDKIQALLERICRREVQDSIAETTAKRLPLDDMEDANFREWASNLSLLASLDPTSDPAFLIPHIRWASRARWSYSEELEVIFALEDGSLPLWLKHVYKIGRYYAATKAMLKLAVKEPKIFTGIHVQPVEAPRQENFSLGNQKEPLLTVLTKMALADPQKLRQELGRTWLTDDPETKFRRACRVNLIVHAEMQLISFYDHHPDLIPRLLFMGTSKKACYLCHEYMSRHPLTIGISASHQKLYPAWLLAPCSSAIRKKHKALLWEFSRHLEETAAHELQTRLGIRRPATMDSTAGPSMTTTATLSTGFWSSKPSLSDEVTDEETLSGASEIK
ncbi:NB-ARC and TPR domain protein [Colletotrichum sojae]|uniref:NB-ARC and TPR domain protein n=1 Tax=Colletotrichum sojae TaxID=2175907 RepID=A0A8H6IPE7_9PEZI|nr:NB-ARC and TPR domain protein [Colletotrichum sojae]